MGRRGDAAHDGVVEDGRVSGGHPEADGRVSAPDGL